MSQIKTERTSKSQPVKVNSSLQDHYFPWYPCATKADLDNWQRNDMRDQSKHFLLIA